MTNPHTYGVQDVLLLRGSDVVPLRWSGVNEIHLDRAHRDEYKVFNDSVMFDYLLFGQEVGVTINCYSYPTELETYTGRRQDATGILFDGGRAKPFGLLFRIETGESDHAYIFVPRLIVTSDGTRHVTASEDIEPLDYQFSGEVIPVRGVPGQPPTYTMEFREGPIRDAIDNLIWAEAELRRSGKLDNEAYTSPLQYLAGNALVDVLVKEAMDGGGETLSQFSDPLETFKLFSPD